MSGAPSIHWLDRVPSTQDVAHQLAADGAEDGTAVVAVEQTAGRGSRGREWASPRGGLWLSVVVRPPAARVAETLSLRAALAAAGALEALGIEGIRVKWPNDLMLDDRKLGGILCEARWSGDVLGWIVIGAGINVANEIPVPLRATATSLSAGGYGHASGDLASPLIAALRAAAGAPGPLAPDEVAAFGRRDWLAGRLIDAPLRGIADGIASDGTLRVRDANGAVSTVRTGPVLVAAGRAHLTPHS